MFLLAGGPGQAASDLYASYAGAFARINRNHDHRAGGPTRHRTNPPRSTCTTRMTGHAKTAKAEAMAALRTGNHELPGKIRRSRALITPPAWRSAIWSRCARALGYAQIDLYGSSYGTRVAELYMRRYPQATHAVILDGVTYPEQAIGPDTPSDGERALDLIVARCLSAPDCAAAYPELTRGPRRAAPSVRTRKSSAHVERSQQRPASRRSNSTAAC